jgi:transposase
VFIDEFGATTNMTRRYARGPRGERIVCKKPHGHWQILSTIAALDINGIRTACCFDGATDTAMFVAFVEMFLVPTLRPGQIIVMDNLSAHKSPRVDELIEAMGARVLRLPPYSPDFNPIEMAISKMKSVLRKLSRRTVEGLEAGVAKAMRAITRNDARGFIKHCGYDGTIG